MMLRLYYIALTDFGRNGTKHVANN